MQGAISERMEEDISKAVQEMFGPSPPPPPPQPPALPTAPVTHPSSELVAQVNADVLMKDAGGGNRMLADGRADLGVTHFQCLAARLAASKVEVTSLVTDSTFGKVSTVEPDLVGTLNPPGDGEVLETFHGARVQCGQDTVNQSISFSIDPATLQCLKCPSQHPVFRDGKPVVAIISDQNFVPKWANNCGDSSVMILRLAYPSLHELGNLLVELMDRRAFPDGSVLLISSVSHLHRVGAGLYAKEWNELVARLGHRWPNIRVGPLVPLLRENCPGSTARYLLEIAAWYAKVYAGSPIGFLNTWNLLVPRLIANSQGQTELKSVETYTTMLPACLDTRAPLLPSTYQVSSSRPSVLQRLDQGHVGELVDSIACTLRTEFSIDVRTTGESCASAGEGSAVGVTRLVTIGASVLKQVASELAKRGHEVTDMSVPGWKLTPESVMDIAERIKGLNLDNSAIVILDLYGNSCSRAVLFDGSMTVPQKGNPGYHLPGKVGLVTSEIFSNLVEASLPIVDAIGEKVTLMLPPQPRYLFSPCCDNRAHCTNVGNPDYSEKLLSETIKLRSVLKRKVLSKKMSKVWILDTCTAVPNPEEKSSSEKLDLLSSVCLLKMVYIYRM
jgi:hypothetical protein